MAATSCSGPSQPSWTPWALVAGTRRACPSRSGSGSRRRRDRPGAARTPPRAVTGIVDTLGLGCWDAPGVSIEIRKRIPVAAGLAGGSADAAAALAACNELWGTGLSPQELRDVASQVGSDVAFALLGGTAIGLGRGDQVTPALATTPAARPGR